MILKGNQRGNGTDLAVHLMNAFDNDSIEVAEIHGVVSNDLLGAFAEFEAVSPGIRAKEYLYAILQRRNFTRWRAISVCGRSGHSAKTN